MIIHPLIHLEIVRQRQRDLLAGRERHQIERSAPADRREDGNLSRIQPSALRNPAPTTTAVHPRRAA